MARGGGPPLPKHPRSTVAAWPVRKKRAAQCLCAADLRQAAREIRAFSATRRCCYRMRLAELDLDFLPRRDVRPFDAALLVQLPPHVLCEVVKGRLVGPLLDHHPLLGMASISVYPNPLRTGALDVPFTCADGPYELVPVLAPGPED